MDFAFGILVEVAQSSTSGAARIQAACAILDRGFGRPGPSSELEAKEHNSMSEILAEIRSRR